MTPPRTAISPPPKGVCTTSMESTARPAGPGCGTRGLRCPWAAAGPGRASHSDTSAAGAEGAGGPGCGAHGRRRGLAELRDDAPSHAQRHKHRRYGGCRRARRARLRCPWAGRGLAGLRDDAPIRICHRAPLGREAGDPGGGTHAVGPGRASHSDTSAAGVEGTEGQAAVPVGGGGAWPGFEATRPATHSDTSAAGVEGAGGHGGPGCGARGRRQGLAGLRDDAPSEARGADGSRAGRRPRAHQAARPSKAHQAARPQHTRPHAIQA